MLIRKDTLRPWQGELLADIRYPRNIEALWSNAELAAIGLVRAVPMTIPDGHRAAGPATYAPDGTETVPTEPIPPPTQEQIEARRDGEADAVLATAIGRILLNHENRLRALEGRPPVTPAQFRAAIRALP